MVYNKYFMPAAIPHLGFYPKGMAMPEIFKVGDPLKVSCSTEVLNLVSCLQEILIFIRTGLRTVCLIFVRSNKY